MTTAATLPAFNGAATVVVDGDVVLDVGHQLPQMVASVSKQFVAVTALVLAERGLVSLTDPVRGLLPELGRRYRRVTLHQLLCHTAGTPHWTRDVPGLWIADRVTLAERIGRLAETPLVAPPGSGFHYSSLGYELAAELLARATGTPYPVLLARELLEPGGLAATSVGAPADPAVEVAVGHRGGRPVPSDELAAADASYVFSTASDLARWTALLHGGLVSESVHRQLVTAHAVVGEPPAATGLAGADYGYGLFLGTVSAHRAWFHPGDNPGFVAATVHLPDHRLSLGLVSPHEETDTDLVVDALLDVVLGRSP